MELIAARITNYKSIVDSGWVEIANTACLFGKSESGKTAFLEALEKINPMDSSRREFTWLKNYPRKELQSYRLTHDQHPSIVVRARFKLTREEISEIESAFGEGALKGEQPTIELHKDYKNKFRFILKVDEGAIVNHFVNSASFSDEIITATLKRAKTLKELGEVAASISTKGPEIRAFIERHQDSFNATGARQIYDHLYRCFPKFSLYAESGSIPAHISIADLRKLFSSKKVDSADDRSLLALLQLGGISKSDLVDGVQYEELALKLQTAANSVNSQVLNCMKQDDNCELAFELGGNNCERSGSISAATNLSICFRDTKDKISFSLQERSPSFVRYFSFVTYFTKIAQDSAPNLIILLDEPGAGLHLCEQRELVRFIENRLASRHQVLYSTNSPVVIDASAPSLPKIVERSETKGTLILRDISESRDRETAVMFQCALSSEIASNLFIGPDCLLVASASDVSYIRMLNEACRRSGKTTLDPRWAIIPVGSAERIALFLTLYGDQNLNVAAMLALTDEEEKRLKSIASSRLLKFAAIRPIDAKPPYAVQSPSSASAHAAPLFQKLNGLLAAPVEKRKGTLALVR